MSRAEFEISSIPLVFISAINPETGKALFDYYSYDEQDIWLEEMEKDFPDFITLTVLNKAAIDARVNDIMSNIIR